MQFSCHVPCYLVSSTHSSPHIRTKYIHTHCASELMFKTFKNFYDIELIWQVFSLCIVFCCSLATTICTGWSLEEMQFVKCNRRFHL